MKDVEGVGLVKFNWGSSYSHHIAARVKMPRHPALGDEIVMQMTFDNGSGEDLYFSANSETVHCLVKIEDRRKRPCPYTTIGANLIGPHRGILMRGDSIPLPAGESVTLKIKLNDYFKFYKDDFRLSLEIPVSGGEAKYRKLIVKDVFFNIES